MDEDSNQKDKCSKMKPKIKTQVDEGKYQNRNLSKSLLKYLTKNNLLGNKVES